MKRISLNIIFSVLILIVLASCNQQKEINTEMPASENADGGITLTKEKINRSGIYFGQIKPELLSYDVSARGQIIVPPQSMASVSVMMGGVIKTINVIPGQQVKKGQVLATYSHPEFIRIQQNYLDAKNNLTMLELEYNRQKKLIAENIKSDKEFQAVETDYFNAKSALTACEAELELLNLEKDKVEMGLIVPQINIESPIDGVIDKIYTNIGMYADMQEPLFEVINLSQLMLQVKVFEKDILFIKNGQRLTFSLSGGDAEDYEGRVINVGSTIDPEGRVITVLASITTTGLNLFPGMFVSAKIHTSEQMLDALPETAIIIDNDDETYGFYTLNNPDDEKITFFKFNVTTGFMEDGYVHVIPKEDLPENAMIALDGVYYIKSEMLKSIE